jgi:hypothetical protein
LGDERHCISRNLVNLYRLPDITGVVESMRLGWARHVDGKTRKYGRCRSGSIFQHTHFEDLEEPGKLSSGFELKQIFVGQMKWVQNKFQWLLWYERWKVAFHSG